jgi:hypothetical protein
VAEDRDEKGRFLKGVSRKAGPGAPKIVSHVRDLAKQHTQAAIDTLVEIMNNKESREAARVAASEVLLDRGWGKATQPVEHQGEAFSLVLNLGGKPTE